MFQKYAFIALLILTGSVQAETPFQEGLSSLKKRASSVGSKKAFDEFLTWNWKILMVTFPEWATSVGFPGQNHRLTDNSLTAVQEREKWAKQRLDFLKGAIKRSDLTPEQQLTYDLLVSQDEMDQNWVAFDDEYLALNQMGSVAQGTAEMLDRMPRSTLQDFEDRLARLRQLGLSIDNELSILKAGLAKGVTPPKVVLRKVPDNLRRLITSDIKKSPYLASFLEAPKSIDSKRLEQIALEAESYVRDTLNPKIKEQIKFLESEYIPGCRESLAVTSLPKGKEWYDLLIQSRTTVPITAEEAHELGLKEVARISKQMEEVKKELKFKGTFDQFIRWASNNKSGRFKSQEEMISSYREAAKRADAELPRLFGQLPRITYGIRTIPAHMADSAPPAYYNSGSLKAGLPGWVTINAARATQQNRWEVESLILHEGVPGHHLQIAIASELENLPEIRKHGGYTAYSEGWGLYAELLGYEMGFYKDPWMKLGQLSNEIWRACRLVVDTGLHSKGWSRNQAIAYMKRYIPKEEHTLAVEVDRYIVWPGQALAYKIGQLKISELRERAEKALGKQFSIREFHDQILSGGGVPLPVLEKRIDTWIASRPKENTTL